LMALRYERELLGPGAFFPSAAARIWGMIASETEDYRTFD